MKLGRARKPIAIVLCFLAGLGGLLCAQALFMIQENHRLNAATGDFAGAGLTMLFLLVYILPMALVALVLALWLAPPSWRRWRAGGPEPGHEPGAGSQPVAPKSRPKLAAGLLAAAGALIVVVGMTLANILRAAHQNYGTQGTELVRLAVGDLMLFSPITLLAGVLGLIGGTMLRPGRGPE